MLILCEKPSVAAEFAKVLGCAPAGGCYRSDRHVITYCVGHLYQLLDPGEYREEWKKWSLDFLPVLPDGYRYKKSAGTSGQADTVNSLIKAHINKDILIATDAGREGELIARIALREAGLEDLSRCRRFWVSEALTPEVIRQGIASAKPLSDYNHTAAQGFARQHADWLVGMNLSRYITLSGGNGEKFSVGRVQSAVLAAAAGRYDRAVNFTPVPYNELELTLEDAGGISIKASLVNPGTKKAAFFKEELPYLKKAFECAEREGGRRDTAVRVTTAEKSQRPDKLFNLTALQKAVYKLYGYSPDETLAIAQALYEKHKCLSYPRTPSRVMGDNNVDLFKEKFNLLKDHYRQWSRHSLPGLIEKTNRHIFNSAALEDHHALIPLALLPEGAGAEERNVFETVTKQFFAVCMADHSWNEHNYQIMNGPYLYRAAVREETEAGWRAVFEKERAREGMQETAGKLDCGSCRIKAAVILDKKTSPPEPYRIDTLLAFMERPKKAEGEEGGSGRLAGLGTPATRAEIIKNLFDRKYIAEEKKHLVPTKKGQWLVKRLRSDPGLARLADAENTTEWEERLEKDPAGFEKSIADYVRAAVKPGNAVPGFEREEIGKCPLCGSRVCEGKNCFFCSAWNSPDKPCKFVIWKTIAGAGLTARDAKLLLLNKATGVKECTSKKAGKKFKASFRLKGNGEIEFIFKNGGSRGGRKRGGDAAADMKRQCSKKG